MKSRLVWIAVSAAAWAFIGGLFTVAMTLLLQSVGLSVEWLIVSAIAVFAYAFVRLVRQQLGAPRAVWLAVAAVQAVSPMVMAAGIIALLASTPHEALTYMLVTGNGGAVLPLADQVSFFVWSDLVPALIITTAAWLGSKTPPATAADAACLTSASS